MLTETEARAAAQRVVDKAKGTAHVDTGWLKRSITYTYVRQEIIFREVYYGAFGENSKLEHYANDMIPAGQKWKIIYTDDSGNDTNETVRTRGGRTSKTKKGSNSGSSVNIKKLIAQIKKNKADGETNQTD